MNSPVAWKDPNTRSRQRAPGPRGSLLMGNLEAYKRDPIAMLLRLQQNYGDVARNQLGPFLTHALAHPDYVQQVLQDNQRNYCRGRFYDNFKLFFGDGLLTTDGEFWLRHRRTVQPLFHKKEVFDHTDTVAAAAMELVAKWQQLPPNQAIDVVDDMMHLSLNVLGKMVFNVDISRHAKTVGPAVRFGLQAMMPQGNLNDFIPRWVPTPFNRSIAKARRGIDQIIGQIIEDHRCGKAETSDIISLLLNARHPTTGAQMTAQEVHDEVMTVFLAGHETTGSGLAWGLYALSQQPYVLHQLRDELDAKLGGRVPSLADLEQLPYLDQVVQEILRIYPPIWGFTRDLLADDEIGGFHIPAGSSVFVSPYVTHRHPEFWANPDAFDPENFGSHQPRRHKFAYFPFGGGMRKCIGFQTALLQMRVILAVVAQHFDLNALPGHPIVRGALISLRPLEGIRLFIKPRAQQRSGSQVSLAEQTTQPAQLHQPAQLPVDTDEPTDTAVVPGAQTSPAAAAQCPFHRAKAATAVASEEANTAKKSLATALAPDAPVAGKHTSLAHENRPLALTAQPFAKTEQPLALGHTAVATAPSAVTSSANPAAQVPVRRFTWFPAAVAALPSQPAPELAGKRIAIVNGRRSTAERMACCLARACAKAVIFNLAADADADPVAAAQELVEQAGPFDGIIDLGLEAGFSLAQADAWEAPMACSLALLQACYSNWLAETQTNRVFYLAVTWLDGLMGYGSGDPHTSLQPLGGLWSGLAKTLPQELPNCNIRVVDLGPEEAGNLERHLLAELYRWGLFEVGYHQGRRYTLQAEQAQLPAHLPSPLLPGDVVLMSGGARGIGLLCARALASRHRVRVVITGRLQPAAGDEPWLSLDEAAFKAYTQDQLRQCGPQRTPVSIRKEMTQLQLRRQLHASLMALAAEGLAVEYRVCDVTDGEAVRDLCDDLGARLRLVIHNAGVDQPIRLASKSFASFSTTVRTKVLGFSHLCRALAGREGLLQLCNVGSLTGRWGGMTGETDYAAANEALARLGLWAAQPDNNRVLGLNCPVKTLVWPTWEEVGMITNFAVTQRYVTPMAVADGIDHWLRELAQPSSAEVMFMGAVGRALTPVQIKGFSPILGLPNINQLISRHHHCGFPLEFQAFNRLITRYPISAREAPFLHGWQLQGQAALPLSMALEHCCGLGDWVVPEGFQDVQLAALVNIDVQLQELVLAAGSQGARDLHIELQSEAIGYWLGEAWHVDVRLRRASTTLEPRTLEPGAPAGNVREVLRLTLVYRTEPCAPRQITPWPIPPACAQSLPTSAQAQWSAQVWRCASWQQDSQGSWYGQVPAADASDLWATPYPPQLRLPVSAIENALRLLWAQQLESGVFNSLCIDQIQLHATVPTSALWLLQHQPGQFAVCNTQGQVGTLIDGARLLAEAHDQDTIEANPEARVKSRP